MKNLTQTKDALAALAQQFRSQNYQSLNESQVRKSFIDEKINRLVYELYELTEEEIRIVEGV